MAKKSKRRAQAPSLSALDKGIYWVLIACSFAACLFLYPAIIGNFRQSVFEDAHILAQNSQGTAVLVFFGLFLGLGLALVFNRLRRMKQPIFGKPDVTYGPPQWKPVYPLVSRQFRTDKKRVITGSLCVLALLSLTVSVTVLGLQPRQCLHDDGSVAVYNCFGDRTAQYSRSDVSGVRICTRLYRDRKTLDDWGIQMEITMKDGEVFFFTQQTFRGLDEEIHGALTGMAQIKASFDPAMITLEGQEQLPGVARDMNLTPEETELLYLLFDAGDPPQ